jgi:ribosomal protein S18 acetylase RimI-like enzyme
VNQSKRKIEIADAEPHETVTEIRLLFEEYQSELGISLCFQNFEEELDGLPGEYAPPNGRLLLARVDEQIAGCIALRPIAEGVSEMKRLYVRPAFRSLGLGKQLADRLIDDARAIGYKKMRLDTLPGKMDRAIAMYRSLGFIEIPRYYDNPYDAALFMELTL